MGLLKFLCKEDIKTKLFSVGHLSMMPSLLNVSPLMNNTYKLIESFIFFFFDGVIGKTLKMELTTMHNGSEKPGFKT